MKGPSVEIKFGT